MSGHDHSCVHKSNGTDPVAGCPACELRVSRSWKLDGRHYRARQIITDEDLDVSAVIDDQESA